MQRHRRAVYFRAALLAVAMVGASLLVGCGGGGATSDETSTTLPPAPTTTAVSLPGKAFADLVGTKLTATEETPEEARESLERHIPMVVAFYVTGGTDDTVVLDSLDTLALRFSDVDFYTFDYKVPAAYGDLARQLQVGYPPQVAFVDSNGVVQGVTSGYADEGTLNQLVTNIR
ncbi:MAG: hypothetical protein ACYC33_01725 [Thermoleophilia bacterium]